MIKGALKRKGAFRILEFSFRLLIALFFCCAVVEGQVVEIDTTFRPPRYEIEVEQFRAFVQSADDIVFVGNSITYYIDWAELLGDPRIKNRGISGDNTFGVKQRIRDLTSGNPAKIFLMIGINDLARNYPQSMIISNFESLVRIVRNDSPRTVLYVQSILPTNILFEKAAQYYDKAAEIERLNEALKSLCKREEIFYIDLHAKFVDAEGQLRREFTYDGVHLTIEGYLHWAEILGQMLAH